MFDGITLAAVLVVLSPTVVILSLLFFVVGWRTATRFCKRFTAREILAIRRDLATIQNQIAKTKVKRRK